MKQEHAVQFDLEEQIERCHRLATALTDEQMRQALEELAEAYQAKLQARDRSEDKGFMLRPGRGVSGPA